MAKLSGIIKIQGSIDDMTFYKGKAGYNVRKQVKIPKERVETDDAFERTRENNSEFSRAAKAGKLLRNSLSDFLKNTKNGGTANRLFAEMLSVLRTDPVNERGKRTVLQGELELLTGFEFNANTGLFNTITAEYKTTQNRVDGKYSVTVDPFIPKQKVTAPPAAGYFKLVSAAVALDFEAEKFTAATSESAALPLNNAEVTIPDLTSTLPPNGTLPVFMVLGIVFLQVVNGISYPLKDKSFNALKLVVINAP